MAAESKHMCVCIQGITSVLNPCCHLPKPGTDVQVLQTDISSTEIKDTIPVNIS